ncbi:MAG: CoA pyrophosphatase [Dehalococcoidia bacterium]|nr:CoA pyrophosphatase [Dehalococcoidia bacterium]
MKLTVESIRGPLARATPLTLDDPGLVPAGVMLLLFPKNGELCALLNKRTNLVEHHKGEISFPGGAQDPEDTTILDTALRETHEEMGVKREDVDILGRLDQVSTGSRFSITPFVGAIPGSYAFKASRIEVAKVLEVPLALLLDRANWREETRFEQRGLATRYAYAFGDHLIYGATARILTQFLGLIAPASR